MIYVMAAKRVAILLESSTTWGAEANHGIARYIHAHANWSVFIEPRGWYERLRLPPRWRGDGILARVTSQRMAMELTATGVPVVNFSYIEVSAPKLVQVTTDQAALGRLAAEHLLDRGYRHLGYAGPVRYPHYVDRCGEAFIAALREAGLGGHVYRAATASKTHPGWELQHAKLGRWLRDLPRPTAIYAWNGERGRQVIDAAGMAGLRVPEDLAVLGGDHDQVMAELCKPPLSCIDHGPRRIGYAGAELLAKLMAGESPPKRPLLFPPLGVIARRSTDGLVVQDEEVATAVRFIRENAHEPIQVEDVIARVPLSRRMLEQRFVRSLGRTPAAEIRRIRVERCKRLLANTDWSMKRIAAASGFNHPEVMIRLFNRATGKTPARYRRELRDA